MQQRQIMTNICIPHVVWHLEPSWCVDTWRPAAPDSGCWLTATCHSVATIPHTSSLPAAPPQYVALLQFYNNTHS